MGRNAKYSEQDILNLFMFSVAQFSQQYGLAPTAVAGLKYSYKNKIKRLRDTMEREPSGEQDQRISKIDELLRENGIDIDNVRGARVGTYEVVTKDEEGEAHVHKLHVASVDWTPKNEVDPDIYEPARAANIRPTKRMRTQRLGRSLLVFGDTQIGFRRVYDETGDDSLLPTHREEILDIITQINAHERPETVVNLSDTIDLAELSRFDPDSDNYHRTLGPAFQRVHDFYAQLKADNPDALIVEVDSNHTVRPTKEILKKMPQFYGFTLPGEEYPLMTYYRLANLGVLGVRFISGYGNAEFIYGEEYGEPPIVFKHGTHSSSAAGSTAKKESLQNPDVHIVRGHGHSYESVARTTRDGRQLYYTQLGASCDTKGSVPSYHSAIDDFGHPVHGQENWQNQVMMIRDYENGQYEFTTIDIINGIAHYNGRRYEGKSEN